MITCENGLPIAIQLAPAFHYNLTILKSTSLAPLPKGEILVEDAAYLSESFKDTVAKQGIELITDKRRNSKKGLPIREWHILKSIKK